MGAIQAGLFLPRAQEVNLPRCVLVRRSEQAKVITCASQIVVNIAQNNDISTIEVNNLNAATLEDPKSIELLTEASEVSVAIPSVKDYPSLVPLFAVASSRKAKGHGPKCLVYVCQNELAAAQQLTNAIASAGGNSDYFQCLDTVIGKMSRTIRATIEIEKLGLKRGAIGLQEAWLVEEYDDIFVTKHDANFTRQLPRFTECADLEPFEIAKLNGHNAAHCAFAFAGMLMHQQFISDAIACQPVFAVVQDAFLNETGAFLQSRYCARGLMFTKIGWQQHAKELFSRMANPWLHDECSRVGRQPERKLGWNDRLVGTIRLVESIGITATNWRLALQCATEACTLDEDSLGRLWVQSNATHNDIRSMLEQQRKLLSRYKSWRHEFLTWQV